MADVAAKLVTSLPQVQEYVNQEEVAELAADYQRRLV